MLLGLRRPPFGWLLLLFLVACNHTAPGADASHPSDGPPRPDAGKAGLIWPAPTRTLEGAQNAHVVRSPTGVLTLIYHQGGKVWAQRAARTGTPLDLGAGSKAFGASASPVADRIFVALNDRQGVSLTDGKPDGPAFKLYGGLASLNNISAGWYQGAPVVAGITSDLQYGRDHYPPTFLAFRVPIDTPAGLPLPEPKDQVLETNVNGYHHYNETHHVLDLGPEKAFLFRTGWREDPTQKGKHMARWYRLGIDPLATGPRANYLVARKSGLMPLPGKAVAWIQAHELGTGKYALTWAATNNSQVYDVWVAGLSFGSDGVPSVSTTPVNVSMTPGMTQNSDFPILRPTGDGRVWIAWREAEFGPRVALLDAKDFHVLSVAAPKTELHCDLTASLGAQVDAKGRLLLAAGFHDGAKRIQLFEFELP